MSNAKQPTTMVHAQKGDTHVIGLTDLHVLLVQDHGCWFAQGLEIDYAAAGSSTDEAKENFGVGLKMTIKEHLVVHGGVQNLLQVAPQETWTEAFQSSDAVNSYSSVQVHDLGVSEQEIEQSKFPFSRIVFAEPKTTAAVAA